MTPTTECLLDLDRILARWQSGRINEGIGWDSATYSSRHRTGTNGNPYLVCRQWVFARVQFVGILFVGSNLRDQRYVPYRDRYLPIAGGRRTNGGRDNVRGERMRVEERQEDGFIIATAVAIVI